MKASNKRNTKHGMFGTRFHRIWKGMNLRCKHKSVAGWKYYGGKGITIDWTFAGFKADMYEPYLQHVVNHGEKDTFIERIDSNQNYSKANCKWATLKEQNRNRSNSTFLSLNGRRQNLVVWAEELNINKDTISTRLMRGWTHERILTTPARRYTEFRI